MLGMARSIQITLFDPVVAEIGSNVAQTQMQFSRRDRAERPYRRRIRTATKPERLSNLSKTTDFVTRQTRAIFHSLFLVYKIPYA
jgi:hypothetical protein